MPYHLLPIALPWVLAALMPVLLTLTRTPETSFYTEMVALLGWGGAFLSAGRLLTRQSGGRGWWGAGLVFLLGAGAWLAGKEACTLALFVACIGLGWRVGRHAGLRNMAVKALWAGYAAAGLAALAICSIQFFAPQWSGNAWVAASQAAGRAVGNLRQPNLQATMVIWGAIAATVLAAQHARVRHLFPVLLAGAAFTLALTSSRTGMVLTGLLLLWGWVDKSLPRPVRGWLMAAPLMVLASLLALWAWAHLAGGSYFAETRAHSGSDISSSRFAIWANTLELIRAAPWTGVGWGNFNFAWTLTAFEKRPVAFFDHTHNLPLQLAVELGIPAALAIAAAFAGWMWHFRAALVGQQAGGERQTARAVLVMLAAVLFHSLLEYPLWYAYFLLPFAFLLGLYAGLGSGGDSAAPPSETQAGSCNDAAAHPAIGWALAAAGVAILLGTFQAMGDYQRITQIFAPRGEAGARPLAERIRDGQRSRLFGAHADYAAVTTVEPPSAVFPAFERPLHRLIDARLMVAYASALAERGERDKAVYVAQRLREFRNPLGDEFFAVCQSHRPADGPAPFQCDTTPGRLTFRDFQAP